MDRLQHGLLRTSSINFLLRLGAAGAGLLANILIARALGPELFGHYAALLAVTALATVLATLGLAQLEAREVAIYHTRQAWGAVAGFMRFSIGATLLAAGVIAMGYYGWVRISQVPWVAAYLLGIPLIVVGALLERSQSVLRGLGHVVASNLPAFWIRPMVSLLLLLPLLLGPGLTLQTTMAIQVVAAATALLVGGYLLHRYLPLPVRQAAPRYEVGEWRRELLPFFALAVVQVAGNHVATLMVAGLGGYGAAGLYSVAARLMDVVGFALSAINMTVQPRLTAALARDDRPQAQQLARRSARLALLVVSLLSLLTLGLGEPLLRLFGEGYGAAWGPLAVLAVGQVVSAAMGACGLLATMGGLQRQVLVILSLSTLGAMAVGWLIIPLWGATGAAWMRSGMVILGNVALALLVWRRLGILTPAITR